MKRMFSSDPAKALAIAKLASTHNEEMGCADGCSCPGEPQPQHLAAFYQEFTPEVVVDLLEQLEQADGLVVQVRWAEKAARAELQAITTEKFKPSARDLAPLQIPAYVDDIRKLCQSMTTFCDNIEKS